MTAFIRAYANTANDMHEAGFTNQEIREIVTLLSIMTMSDEKSCMLLEDYIDLKSYEGGMRHLIDSYISAKDSRKDLCLQGDMTLIDLLDFKGEEPLKSLPEGMQE
ncbi:MAG: hypothetical protein U5K84_03125 [Alkalibacterium sp.]|nr:hypothetical protein [Alkalibacterium sp.]